MTKTMTKWTMTPEEQATKERYPWPGAAQISGFGGDYEEACRVMFYRGISFAETHRDQLPLAGSFRTIRGVIGWIEPMNDTAKALVAVMNREIEPSGAMVHAVVLLVGFFLRHGYDKWSSEMLARET